MKRAWATRRNFTNFIAIGIVIVLGAMLFMSARQPVLALGGQQRVAYYGNWDIYGNGYYLKNLVTTGAASRLTTLVYGFENIDPSALTCFQTIKAASTDESNPNAGDGAGDAWADYQMPFGADKSVNGQADSASQALKGNFNQLKELEAKYPNLKIILSIGGWTFSKYFSDAAATQASRTNFVNSCVDMYIRGNLPTGINGDPSGGQGVAKGIFDGLDIDWEFPAGAGHVGNHSSPNDTANYTSLLAEFRSQLDAQGTADGKHYILTAAVPSDTGGINNIQASQIMPYLDWAGIMSYDMHGSWESSGPTDFQAPLYPSLGDPHASDALSVDQAVKRWENAGWPANKLVVGVPFYWRGWSGVPAGSNSGLYQSATGASPAYPYSQQPGVALFKELLTAGKMYNTRLDVVTGSPWIYDNGNFYTGDTPNSVTQKAQYVRSNGLLGVMMYSLEGDDAEGTMLKSVVSGLNGGGPAPLPSPAELAALSRTSLSSGNTATNGEPINMIGGNYLLTRHELTLPGRDAPVDFALNYNSAASGLNGPVGWGWTDSYRVTAVTGDDGSVVVQNPDGRMDQYTPNAQGGYTSPQGIHDTLTTNNGVFKVTHKDRSVYNFNAQGLLASIVSPNGNTQTLAYDANNNLATLTDSVGRKLTFAYNILGQLASATDPSGRTVSYTYDALGNLVQVQNPAGEITKYVYDADHHITNVIDPRGSTVVTNVYDDQGRVIRQTNGLGATVSLAYAPGQTTFTDANGGQTVYFYDAQLRLTKQQDALGNATTVSYDSNGNPTQSTDALGRVTTRTYDANGNVTQITDPAGGVQTFTYDASNDLLTRTDQLGHTTSYAYDASGNVTQKTDPIGVVTKFTYDSSGETTAITDSLNDLTGFVYDASGNQVTKTDPSNRNTYYGYDGVGRLTAVENAGGNETDYTLDAMNRVTKVTDPAGDAATYAYDADGNETQAADPNGHTTSYQYDANNQLTKTTDGLGQATTYTYDANGHLIGKTDAKGRQTVYAYDALGQQTQTTDPLGGIVKLAYDASGNVVSRTDASNRVTTYSYDVLNQLTKATYPDGTTAVYTYDAAGDVLTAVSAAGTTTYTYDADGRVLTAKDPHNAVVTYTYNSNGSLIQIKYPDNKTVSYTYTPSGQLSTAKDWNNAQTTYLYDNNAQLAVKTLPNTFKATYSYDANGNLSSLVYKKGSSAFTRYDYGRDADGNITDDTETKANGTQLYSGYTYDADNQLTIDDAPAHTYSYAYDEVGNIKTSVLDGTTSTYAYNNDNELTSKGSRTFTYDNQGNEITDGTKTMSYGFDNQLKSYTSGSAVTSFVYDAAGNRIEKSLNGVSTYQYVNDTTTPNAQVLVTKNVAANTQNYNVYGGTDLISQGGPNTTDRQYYLTDGLGNVRYLTSSTGTTLNSYSYDPYGSQTVTGSTANNFTFQNEQKDTESGLFYLNARTYDPTTARFLSQDPSKGTAFSPQTQNGYNYANDNPINLTDPSGMSALSNFGRALAAITGISAIQADIRECNNGALARDSLMSLAMLAGLAIPGLGEAEIAADGIAEGAAMIRAEETASAISDVGSRSAPLMSREQASILDNEDTQINGRLYSGHALDGMQNAGIYPSVIENTISEGTEVVVSSDPGTARLYESTNDVTAIVNKNTGKVVTTFYGK